MIKIIFLILITVLIVRKNIENFSGTHTHTLINTDKIIKYTHNHKYSHIHKKNKIVPPMKFNVNQCGNKLQLNLSVHLLDKINFNYKNKKYNSYINEYLFIKEILPAINEIWKDACISWTVKIFYKENIDSTLSYKYPNNFERRQILNTSIDKLCNSNNNTEKMSILHNMFNKNCYNNKDFHLYFLPFLGNNSITFYKNGIFSFIGTWYKKDNELFQKIKKKKKFIREISKHLGYSLNLVNNNSNNLMGSGLSSRILKQDIRTARNQAKTKQPKFNKKNKDMILNNELFIKKDCSLLNQNTSNNFDCLFTSKNINLIVKKDNSLENYYQKLAKEEEKKNRNLPEFKKRKFIHDDRNNSFY